MRPAGDTIEPISKGRLKAGPAALSGAAAIASCGQTGAVVLAGGGPAYAEYTNKLPGNDPAEFTGGAECNSLNALKARNALKDRNVLKARNVLKDWGLRCGEPFDRVVCARPICCYRTPGQIDCYDKKGPHGRNSTRVRAHVRQGMESPYQWPM